MKAGGKVKRGRPKNRWERIAIKHLRKLGIEESSSRDRMGWRLATSLTDPRESGKGERK